MDISHGHNSVVISFIVFIPRLLDCALSHISDSVWHMVLIEGVLQNFRNAPHDNKSPQKREQDSI